MSRSRLLVVPVFLLLLAAVASGVWWFYLREVEEGPLALELVTFADLPGWGDVGAALKAFQRSCVKIATLKPDKPMAYAGTAHDWQKACDAAKTAKDARAFFEHAFKPYEIAGPDGLVTGYYEPLLYGSRERQGKYQTPVYAMPPDLVSADLGAFNPDWKGEKLWGRLKGDRIVPYPSRAGINADPPKNAKVLFYGDDDAAVFFLHIQGSGRVWLDDGTILRVNYAGQNGHPYTPIGRVLIRQYGVPREGMSMQVIRAWLKAHPNDAQKVMETDASFIFFEERPVGDPALGPSGSAGVPLTPRGSIAVDNKVHPFGVPVFIAGDGLANLFIAQDTGGAIRGNARADIFFGFGASAETTAGGMKAYARFYVLLPKSVTPKLPT